MQDTLEPFQQMLQRMAGGRGRLQAEEDEKEKRGGARLRDIDQVAKVCPFIKDTLDTGGTNYSEVLWKFTLNLAAGCEDSVETAHRLSRGYVGYNEEETEGKLAEVQKAAGENPKVVFVHCNTIRDSGATQCASCPHIELGKSPLTVPGAFTPPADIIPDVVDPLTGRHQSIPGGVYTDCDENLTRIKERFCVVYRGKGGGGSTLREYGGCMG
jgi:hypothetical protein